jgi:hypothetical protein
MIQMGVVDADHHTSQFACNQLMSVPMLREGALLGQNDSKCDSLPACAIEILRPIPWQSFHGPDVRKVRGGPVLAHHPKAGVAPARSGVQAPLEVIDLAATLRRLTNLFKNRVIPFDEGDEVSVVARGSDTLPVPIPMQKFLVVFKSSFLGR